MEKGKIIIIIVLDKMIYMCIYIFYLEGVVINKLYKLLLLLLFCVCKCNSAFCVISRAPVTATAHQSPRAQHRPLAIAHVATQLK